MKIPSVAKSLLDGIVFGIIPFILSVVYGVNSWMLSPIERGYWNNFVIIEVLSIFIGAILCGLISTSLHNAIRGHERNDLDDYILKFILWLVFSYFNWQVFSAFVFIMLIPIFHI